MSFYEFISRGGPVMWVLLGLSILAIMVFLQRLFHPSRPVEARHDHVGDEYVDLQIGVFQRLQRRLGAFGFQHRVAAHPERPRGEGPDRGFILDKKNDALARPALCQEQVRVAGEASVVRDRAGGARLRQGYRSARRGVGEHEHGARAAEAAGDAELEAR